MSNLTAEYVAKELGIDAANLESILTESGKTLPELHKILADDPVFQVRLRQMKTKQPKTAAEKAIDTIFGKLTPLPENTTIPTTLTSRQIRYIKSQEYKPLTPQVLTGKERANHDALMREHNVKGAQAIEAMCCFIATGKLPEGDIGKYINTNAIPKAHKNTLRTSDIDTVLKDIEQSYLMSPDYKREIKAIEAHLDDRLNEDGLVLTQRYRNLIHSLAKVLTAYDRDSVDRAVTEFIESKMESGFDVSPKHQEMLDGLIQLKYGDIEEYEMMATRYETTEQPSSGQHPSMLSGHDLYIIKKQITGGTKNNPDENIGSPYNPLDLEKIRALGEKSRGSRKDSEDSSS